MNKPKKSKHNVLLHKTDATPKKAFTKKGSGFSEGDAIKLIHELRIQQLELELQREELLSGKAQADNDSEKDRESNEFATSGYFKLSRKGVIVGLNQNGARLIGKDSSEIIRKKFVEFVSPESTQAFNSFIEKIFKSKINESCELSLIPDCKLPIFLHLTGIISTTAGQCFITAENITERRLEDIYREMAKEILSILSETGNFENDIRRIINVVKKATGFDAVGIRLQQGDDFPYFYSEGFSIDFLQKENQLVSRNREGGVCRDENGNLSLECTCGLVISGKIEPGNPLFTAAGSSWTNNSFPFLDLPESEDPRTKPRNLCIHKGYASIAHIPIRAKGRIIGLLQLNNRRKDCFTLPRIEMIEAISGNIGEAFLRKRAEDILKRNDALLYTTQKLSHIGGWDWDVEKERMLWTEETYRLHEIDPSELAPGSPELIKRSLECYLPEDRLVIEDAFQRSFKEGLPYDLSFPFTSTKGKKMWIRTLSEPVMENGKVVRVSGYIMDITDRKQTDQRL